MDPVAYHRRSGGVASAHAVAGRQAGARKLATYDGDARLRPHVCIPHPLGKHGNEGLLEAIWRTELQIDIFGENIRQQMLDASFVVYLAVTELVNNLDYIRNHGFTKVHIFRR